MADMQSNQRLGLWQQIWGSKLMENLAKHVLNARSVLLLHDGIKGNQIDTTHKMAEYRTG